MSNAPVPARPTKSSLVVPALVIGVLIIVAGLAYKELQFDRPKSSPGTTPAADGTAPEAAPVDPKDLVADLATVTGKEPVTAAQAQKWKDSLQQLIHGGAASIPAIQQFLAQNLDANYAGVSGAGALGYSSLRAALLDALVQIGGPESTEAMLEILRFSHFPTDVPVLANALETQEPRLHRDAIFEAACQQLGLAKRSQSGEAYVLPLFQVLVRQAAGCNAKDIFLVTMNVRLLQDAKNWPYYSTIVLSSLPDGSGVTTLISLAQRLGSVSQVPALQALAQWAPKNQDALKALLDLTKSGQLSDDTLAQLAPYLAGRELQLGPPTNPAAPGNMNFHVPQGNQDYSAFDATGKFTPEQINQRISVIDQFLQAVPPADIAALDMLQKQRDAFSARLPR